MLQQPQESENSVLRSPNDMADNFGTALFARVLLWGHGVYVNRDNRYLPSDYQNTVENTQKSKIFALTNASNLPSIKEIQKMLRKSITSLSPKQYALLQTIMMDLWATQTFAEPLTSHERKSKKNQQTNIDDDEESDNDSTNNSSNDEDKSTTAINKKGSCTKTNYNYFQQMSQSTGEQDNTNMTTPNVQKNNFNIELLSSTSSAISTGKPNTTTPEQPFLSSSSSSSSSSSATFSSASSNSSSSSKHSIISKEHAEQLDTADCLSKLPQKRLTVGTKEQMSSKRSKGNA